MQTKKFAVSINGKKSEIYCENENVFLMSHTAGWARPNGLQPEKMHSWKSAAYLCPVPASVETVEQVAAAACKAIENVIGGPVTSVSAWEGPKFTRTKEQPAKEQPAPAEVPAQEQEQEQARAARTEQPAPAAKEQPAAAPAALVIPAANSNTGSAVDALAGLSGYLATDIYNRVLAAIAPVLEQARPVVTEVNVTSSHGTHKVTGKTHKEFARTCKLVDMGLPVYLVGDTGTGKTTLAKQVAEALGLPFYKMGAAQTKYDYTGYNDAGGNYVPTGLAQAVMNGGVCLCDEVDGSQPDALLCINALRDGDAIELGGKMYQPHKDFRLIVTANTVGTGATEDFTGRNALDAAFLNGFIKVKVDYDPDVELAAAGGDAEITAFINDFRAAAAKCGVRCPVSSRNIKMMYAQAANNENNVFGDHADMLGSAILLGIEKDTLQTIYNRLENKYNNVWAKAMADYINRAA